MGPRPPRWRTQMEDLPEDMEDSQQNKAPNGGPFGNPPHHHHRHSGNEMEDGVLEKEDAWASVAKPRGMAEPWANELASAAARGDLAQVTHLLGKNVNVNGRNGFGRTPLQVMKLGNPEIARRLLLRGADPDLKDRRGFAVLHDAARAGFLDTLQTLLEFQADVNVEDGEGNLPLHLAAQEGHLPVVAFLLERTACRAGHRNHRGATAYDLARLYKRHEVAQLLEERAGGGGGGGGGKRSPPVGQ